MPYKSKEDKAKQMRKYRKRKKTEPLFNRYRGVYLIWDDVARLFVVMQQVGFSLVSISRKELGNDEDWFLKVIKRGKT